MLKFFKSKNKIIILLMAVTVLGAFFRFYDLFDLMLFETDQARDYKLISEMAGGGMGEFPLVGPKAGGTLFRLGSIYYVPAYFLAVIFGVSPYILTFPEAILSVLTIPLVFIFLKEFFNNRISLYCTTIFAGALFFVEYAHFSWNPNYIPFFLTLSLLAILKYSQNMQNVRWIFVLAFATGITMQLHTITLVAMPLIIISYFTFLRKRIMLKHIAIFTGILIFLFSPLIINDFLTKGENLREFKKAAVSRGERDDHPSLGKSIFMNPYNYARYYSMMLSSHNQIKELARVESSKNLRELIGNNISKQDLKRNLIIGLIIMAVMTGGFLLLVLGLVRLRKKNKDDELTKKRNFLALIIAVQIIFTLVLYPLALRVDSRYYLPVFIVPFVLLGLFFSAIEEKFSYGKKITMVLFVILFLSNILGSINWLRMLEGYSFGHEKNKEFILDKYFIVTMQQWDGIIEKTISLSSNHNGNTYIQSTPFHINSFRNLLEVKEKKPVRIMDTKNLDSTGMYFFLRESSDIEAGSVLPESVGKRFDIVDKYNFGTVTLIQMKIKANQETREQEKFLFPGKPPSLPRCYELSYHIEARENCTVGDIGYLFGEK